MTPELCFLQSRQLGAGTGRSREMMWCYNQLRFPPSFLPPSLWSIAYDGIQNRNLSMHLRSSPRPWLCIFYIYVYGVSQMFFYLYFSSSLKAVTNVRSAWRCGEQGQQLLTEQRIAPSCLPAFLISFAGYRDCTLLAKNIFIVIMPENL